MKKKFLGFLVFSTVWHVAIAPAGSSPIGPAGVRSGTEVMLSPLVRQLINLPDVTFKYDVLYNTNDRRKSLTCTFTKMGERWRLGILDRESKDLKEIIAFNGKTYQYLSVSANSLIIGSNSSCLPGSIVGRLITNPAFCAAHFFFLPARDKFVLPDIMTSAGWAKALTGLVFDQNVASSKLSFIGPDGDSVNINFGTNDKSYPLIVEVGNKNLKHGYIWRFNGVSKHVLRHGFITLPEDVRTEEIANNTSKPGNVAIKLISGSVQEPQGNQRTDGFFEIPITAANSVWDDDIKAAIK